MAARIRFALLVLCLAAWAACAGEPPGVAGGIPPPGDAKVLAATYLGGPGAEWLCAGAFTPDGTIVLAGVSLDAEVILGGVQATALGEDAPPVPPLPRLVPPKAPPEKGATPGKKTDEMDELLDKIATTKEGPRVEEIEGPLKPQEKKKPIDDLRRDQFGNIIYDRLHWNRADATGFVALATPDLRRILSVRRFPRGAGAITALAVGPDGAIYVAGPATARTAKLSPEVKTLPVPDPAAKGGECDAVYVAKLSPDAAQVLWVRRLEAPSPAPRLRLLPGGQLLLTGPDLRTFDADGNVKHTANIPKGVTGGTGVSPKDGMIAKAHEWMWGTGREPWRCPTLHIYYPDGRLRYQLSSWPGPFAGVDALRLVADSTFRKAVWDEQGQLLVSGWSHGGNTVNARLPQDIERFWPYNGLNANIDNSCNYIVKLEPADFRVVAATAWPGGKTWTLGYAADGSVVWNGEPSHLSGRTHLDLTAADSGDVLVVCDPTLRVYRFFAPMPACGRYVTAAGDRTVPEDWCFATGTVAGRTLLLCLTGARPSIRTEKGEFSAPQCNAAQPAFGGGGMDGYALLLELPPLPSAPAAAPPGAGVPAAPPVKPVDEAALRVVKDKEPRQPPEGQLYKVAPHKYRTVMVAFRDPADRMWPSFFFGGPAGDGSFTYRTKEKPQAAFALRCTEAAQSAGEQQRRVMGELLKERKEDGKTRCDPQVSFVLSDMSPWRLEEKATVSGEVKRVRYRIACTLSGEFQVGDHKLALREVVCHGSFRVSAPPIIRNDPASVPNTAELSARFVVKGSDLGLKNPALQDDIQVHLTWTGLSDIVYWTPPQPLAPGTELELKE